jgi:large subunit ribosomal protein L25
MIKLSAKPRTAIGRKTRALKEKGIIPAVVYGTGKENTSIEIEYESFRKLFEEVGESALISLEIAGEKKERPVLIYEIQKDPVSGKFIHVDFYQASLKQEVEVTIPLVFEGVSLAVKELGGTLLRETQEVKIKALPQNLPHDIKVDITSLKTFDDEILIKDLKIPAGVKILKGLNELVATVAPAQKVEEDLAKAIEEKVEDIEKVEKPKKEKEEEVAEAKPAAAEKKPEKK